MKTKLLKIIHLGWVLTPTILWSGCATRFHTTPVLSQGYVTSETARQKAIARPSGDLAMLKTVRDGAVLTTDTTATDYCLTLLEQVGLFSRISYKSPSKADKEIASITLEFDQKEYPHSGANVGKAFFIGFTFFLLTPVLPMTYGFDSEMKATIHFADGEAVICRQATKGKCSYNFLSYPVLAMQSKVLEENYKVLRPDFVKTLPTGAANSGVPKGARD